MLGQRRGRRAAILAGGRAGVDHRRVQHAPARDHYPQPTGGQDPRAEGTHSRNSTPDREVSASGGRFADLGERTLTIDCDVLQADGGTRTAAITGAYVALVRAIATLKERNDLSSTPIICAVAATSVGLVNGQVMLDLTYEEDYRAEADFNVVMTDRGEFVEVQGTAEKSPFSKAVLDEVLSAANEGISHLFRIQRSACPC